jgi:dihydrofolate reductase
VSGTDEVPGTTKETSAMTRITCDMSVSVDGFTAGPNQSADKPFGDGPVDRLHRWMFEQPEANAAEIEAITTVGAFIMGRNMFSPGRGEWDESWKGWWGDEPPYHVPTFVLTHHARPPLRMAGGTTFHFVTGGIRDALSQAREAAGGRDIRLGGGVATIRQFLNARLIDQLHLAIRPVLLGRGESLLHGIDMRALGYECVRTVAGERATHVYLRKRADDAT